MNKAEISVLNFGFVRLIEHMGSDLNIANAARVSFGKSKTTFDSTDKRLLGYLAEHGHTSPFRHTAITFHIKAPIFVFRQWMKHRIASEFNEISGRYIEFKENEFFVPNQFRQQSKENKQGSEGEINECNVVCAKALFLETCHNSIASYKKLIALGVCREQARCVLPLGLYSEAYWTVSLQAAAHFIKLRTDSHAQWEIQQYANAVRSIIENIFPVGLNSLLAGH
jgi:thymidylate synthase (FAD)